MNSLNIHNVKEITLSEIKDLDTCYSLSIFIRHNIYYKDNATDNTFEITLFTDKENRKALSNIKFFIPIKQ